MGVNKKCDQCNVAFKSGESYLGIDNNGKDVALHGKCEKAWRAANEEAPECFACKKRIAPLSEGMTFALPGQDMVTLHARCQTRYVEEHSTKCDHCNKAVTNEMVRFRSQCPNTSAQKEFTVHEQCSAAFEAELKKKKKAPPPTTKPTVLTPPSKPRQLKGVKCAHCAKTNQHQPMVVLPGPWGAANVHEDCIELFEKKVKSSDVGMGTTGVSRCDGCLKRFATTDKPIMVKKPGGSQMVEMHDACYKRKVAKEGK